MINSNLVYVRDFYDTFVEPVFQQMSKNWSAELQGPDSSREYSCLPLDFNFEIDYRIKTRRLKKLNKEQQIYFYVFLRLMLNMHPKDALISLILEDFQRWFEKRYRSQLIIKKDKDNNIVKDVKLPPILILYRIYKNCTDNQLIYHLDEILWNQKKRRHFFRTIFSKIPVNRQDNWSLFDYLKSSDCLPLPVYLPKKRPKKTEYHKGYRDHGSLGSDFSTILKEQARTEEYQEILRQEQKLEQDPIDLLAAFLDLEPFDKEGDS